MANRYIPKDDKDNLCCLLDGILYRMNNTDRAALEHVLLNFGPLRTAARMLDTLSDMSLPFPYPLNKEDKNA